MECLFNYAGGVWNTTFYFGHIRSTQPKEDMPTQTWNIQAENIEETPAQTPQIEVEVDTPTLPNDADFETFLEPLSPAELRTFEKFLMEEISEPVQTPKAFETKIVDELREQFGFQDEDDLQRFLTENPELTTYLQKHLKLKNKDSK